MNHNQREDARRETSSLWLLLAVTGFIVWSLAFVVLYAVQGLGCALGWYRLPMFGSNALTMLLLSLWIGHLALIGVLGWYGLRRWWPRRAGLHRSVPHRAGPRRVEDFLAALACLTVAGAFVATLYIGAPILLLPPCN